MSTIFLTITSRWAQTPGYNPDDFIWMGSVDIEGETYAEVNENIFRLFNCVTQEDVEQLDRINYHLPSLSVGDIIEWFSEENKVPNIYRVEPVGFLALPNC